MPDVEIDVLERRCTELASQMTSVGAMRSGSLGWRFRRCGTPSCHCARPGDAGHPQLLLTRKRSGKVVSRNIPASAEAEVRAEIAAYRRFQHLSREFVEAGNALSDARRRAAREPAAPAAQPAAPAAKKGAPASVRTAIEREVEALMGVGPVAGLDFEAVEMGVRRMALGAAVRMTERPQRAENPSTSGKRSRSKLRPKSIR
jgi:hypothetical protein